jgi:hypothetical protein
MGDVMYPAEPKAPEKVETPPPIPEPESEAARYPNRYRYSRPRFLPASAHYGPARKIQ